MSSKKDARDTVFQHYQQKNQAKEQKCSIILGNQP